MERSGSARPGEVRIIDMDEVTREALQIAQAISRFEKPLMKSVSGGYFCTYCGAGHHQAVNFPHMKSCVWVRAKKIKAQLDEKVDRYESKE